MNEVRKRVNTEGHHENIDQIVQQNILIDFAVNAIEVEARNRHAIRVRQSRWLRGHEGRGSIVRENIVHRRAQMQEPTHA